MKTITFAVAAALLVSGGAATAQTARDAQCIIVANAFAKDAKDPDQKRAAEAAIYFYLGRVGDSMKPAELKTLLDAQSKALTDATAGPTMDKCVAAIQAKIQMMQGLAGPAKATPAPGR
jgi:hypothetical protein